VRELQSAAAAVRMIGLGERDSGVALDGHARFPGRFAVDTHVSGENQRARTFARRRKAAVDDELIEAGFRHQVGPAEAGP